MPLRAKLQIACGVAAALDHAHAHNIVHRDVKPGNVIITEDGRPKLMDFGIAKREDASLTQTGTFLGTPSYASPEQIRRASATLLSDVFSFGVMIFELLSGSLPFPGASINTILYKIVNEPPLEVKPPVSGLLPDGWQRVFSKVLAKNSSGPLRLLLGLRPGAAGGRDGTGSPLPVRAAGSAPAGRGHPDPSDDPPPEPGRHAGHGPDHRSGRAPRGCCTAGSRPVS